MSSLNIKQFKEFTFLYQRVYKIIYHKNLEMFSFHNRFWKEKALAKILIENSFVLIHSIFFFILFKYILFIWTLRLLFIRVIIIFPIFSRIINIVIVTVNIYNIRRFIIVFTFSSLDFLSTLFCHRFCGRSFVFFTHIINKLLFFYICMYYESSHRYIFCETPTYNFFQFMHLKEIALNEFCIKKKSFDSSGLCQVCKNNIKNIAFHLSLYISQNVLKEK